MNFIQELRWREHGVNLTRRRDVSIPLSSTDWPSESELTHIRNIPKSEFLHLSYFPDFRDRFTGSLCYRTNGGPSSYSRERRGMKQFLFFFLFPTLYFQPPSLFCVPRPVHRFINQRIPTSLIPSVGRATILSTRREQNHGNLDSNNESVIPDSRYDDRCSAGSRRARRTFFQNPGRRENLYLYIISNIRVR